MQEAMILLGKCIAVGFAAAVVLLLAWAIFFWLVQIGTWLLNKFRFWEK